MNVWKTVKVFISSTFKDLEVERDQLAKVFKQMQEKLFKRKIHLVLYDLRWQDRHDQDLVSWCLDLVQKSHYFIGILGDRYGWCPPYCADGTVNYEGTSITEMEIQVALANVPKENRIFYTKETINCHEKITKLISFLVEKQETVEKYSDTLTLQQSIEASLLSLIEKEYSDEAVTEEYTYLEALNDVIESKAQGFVGRMVYLQQLSQFIKGSESFCVITGVAGQGKSSLVAQYSKEYTKRFSGAVFSHFSSMTTDSNTFFSLLKGLSLQISGYFPEQNLLDTSEALLQQVLHNLAQIDKPILLIIDGIDEFSQQEKLNTFLSALPQNVKVILTTRFLWKTPFVYHKIELHNLTEDEISKIIYIYEQEHNFTLSTTDKEILFRRANGNPLFLKVALDEIANEGVAVGQMAESIDILFSQIIERLQNKHGKELVDTFLGIVSGSRHGIMEAEVYEIINNTFGTSISDIVLLQKSLQSFVIEKRKILHFFHPEFERSIKMLMGRGQMRVCHQILANYFKQKRWNYQRSLSELPYHLLWAEMHKELLELFTDIEFLKAKCREGLLGELIEDFSSALHTEVVPIPDELQVLLNQETSVSRGTLKLLLRAIELDVQHIQQFPQHLFQCLWNRGYWHDAPGISDYYESKVVAQKHEFHQLVKYWYDPNKSYPWLKAIRPLPERIDSPLEKQILCSDVAWAVSMHPNKNLLTVALQNKKAQTWDLTTGSVVKVWQHPDAVWSVGYNSQGKKMVTASGNDVYLWDTDSEELIVRLSGHSRPVTKVIFTPRGDKIVSTSEDATIKIWDVHSFRCLRTLQDHQGSVWNIIIANDAMFSVSEDKTIKIWDLESGYCQATLRGHNEGVQDIAHKDEMVVSAGENIRIWDIHKEECIAVLDDHEKNVYSVAIDESGKHIISGSYDNTFKVWSLETKECVATYLQHQNFITNILVRGENIITACYDKYVRIWNLNAVQAHHQLHEHKTQIRTLVAFNDILASGSKDGEIMLWNAKNGCCITTLQGHEDDISSFAFTKDGKRLISSSWDGNICVWDTEERKLIHTIRGHERMVETIFLSADEKILVSAGTEQEIYLWDMTNYGLIQTFRGHNATIHHVCLSDDNQILVSADIQQKVRIWNIAEKRFISVTLQDTAKINAIHFTQNNTISIDFADNTVEELNLDGKTISKKTYDPKYQKDMFHVELYNVCWLKNNILAGSHDNHLYLFQLKGVDHAS